MNEENTPQNQNGFFWPIEPEDSKFYYENETQPQEEVERYEDRRGK